MKFKTILLSTILILLLVGLFWYVNNRPNTKSNDTIRIVSSVMKNDKQGLKYIEVTVEFRKKVSGHTDPDKGVDIFTQLRRYGKMPDKEKLFYFYSEPSAKVFVDLYDLHKKLIRTDSSYYNEYMPSLKKGEIPEILPGEKKTLIFGVPENVESYRVWLISRSNVSP